MLEVGKKITELRVCDLKDELEKRKLETVGPKAVLIERLERVCIEKGYKTAASCVQRIPIAGFKRGGCRPQYISDYTGCKGQEADAVADEG